MAKMFYTLDEAAERLGVTPTSVRDLVTQGRLQEFRDRDKLMFKVEQVELLAGGEGEGEIPLASDQSGTGIPIIAEDPGASGSGIKGASGSGIPLELEPTLESPKERSGVSIFDADETEQADPSAVTQVTASPVGGGGELTMESVGSGSGLLDLTRESDDTSLGADLLQDVYGAEGSGGHAVAETGGTSGLFETTGAASDVSGGLAPAGVVMVAAEPFDGPGSGLTGGLALGALIIAALSTAIVVFGIVSGNATAITDTLTGLPSYPWSYIGAGAAAVLVFGIIGWLIGKKS